MNVHFVHIVSSMNVHFVHIVSSMNVHFVHFVSSINQYSEQTTKTQSFCQGKLGLPRRFLSCIYEVLITPANKN